MDRNVGREAGNGTAAEKALEAGTRSINVSEYSKCTVVVVDKNHLDGIMVEETLQEGGFMASLTLKNIPENLMDLLREAAGVERRSLSQEALYLIEEGLRRRLGDGTPLKPHVAAQVAAWERIAGRWSSEKPIADEVKDVLTSRTPGRPVDL